MTISIENLANAYCDCFAASAFPHNFASLFIFPQSNKSRMSQVTVRRPFGELNPGDQLRLKPHAVLRLFLGQSSLGSLFLGEIGKRASVDL